MIKFELAFYSKKFFIQLNDQFLEYLHSLKKHHDQIYEVLFLFLGIFI
jgi:hypothetical protein